MPTIKLDRNSVNKCLLPTGKDVEFYWDTALKGFALQVLRTKSGTIRHAWFVQRRNKSTGKMHKEKLGDVALLTFTKARDLAKEKLSALNLGQDPTAEKRAARAAASTALTFAKAADQYIAEKERQVANGDYRPSSLKNTRIYLTGYYFAPLHKRGLDDIKRADVAACLNTIGGKSGEVSRGRTRAAISALYVWAMQEGLCEQNPVIGTRPQADRPQGERVLDDDELRKVWNACDMQTDFGKIVRLLILTGCRRQEIGGLRWSEVDLDKGTITIPGERTKNGRTHTLTLPDMAMEIIRSVHQRVDREQLFGERAAEGFNAWYFGMHNLKCDVSNFSLHDLRRTFRTRLGKLGIPPHISELCVNHSKKGIVAVYDRYDYQGEIAEALLRWANHVHSVVTLTEPKVVSLPSRTPAAVA
jgi:integrase